MNEAKFTIDTLGNLQFSSTFTSGTFELTNNSNSQDIVSITLDLSSAIFPDLVFDPLGNAGDTTAKGFSFDSANDAGNTVAISNYPYNSAAAPFSSLRDGGYDVMKIDFDSFEPGQTLKFSVDVDPTSIKGAGDPGPSDSGSISGLELVGATITVKFADDSELTGQVYRSPGSEVASEVTLAAAPQAAPEIAAIGFDGSATVGDANQTIKITGTPGSEVSVLILEGGLYTEANGGNDIDPFEANRAIAVNELTATVGANGTVDVPVTLTHSDVDGSGGLNYIVAKYQGVNSAVTAPVVLEYIPNTTNPGTGNPGTGNPGTPTTPDPNAPTGTIRIQAEDYKAGVNGTEYFDFNPENLSGQYRPNEAVDIETTGDVGGGFNVSFIQDGEFLTYDVNVAEAGTYDVVLRVATPSADTQSTEVTINGQTYTADFSFTGGWQEYQDVLVTNVSLAAGVQELRLDMKSSQFNLNYIDLVAAEPGANIDRTAPTAVLNTTARTKQANGVAPLNFTITYSDDKAINAATIDANDLVVTAPDGSTAAVSLVGVDTAGNGTPRTATYAIAAPGGSWNGAEAGDYTIALKAGEVSDTNNNSAAAEVLGNLTLYVVGDDEEPANPGTGNPGTPTTPDPNAPAGTIRIQAEDYKAGVNGTEYFDFNPENVSGQYRPNEAVDIETTGDVGGGFNVSFIQDGEFLTYDVNVAEAGTYDVVLRVATPSEDTQSTEVTINGQTYTADFSFTGGWQEYQDVLVTNVALAAGVQELRLDMKSSQFNLNYIDLVAAAPGANIDRTAPTAVLNTMAHTKNAQGVAPLEFTITYSDDKAINAATIDANDLVVTAPDGSTAAVSLVGVDTAGNGTPRTATYAIAAPGGSWNGAEAGDYTIALKAGEVSDTNNNAAAAEVLGNLTLYVVGDDEEPANPGTGNPGTGNPGTPTTPDPNAPTGTIRIQAEDYKAGVNGTEYFDFNPENVSGQYRPNEAVDIETTGDVGGGFNVSFIQDGEFLTYDVNVAEAGTYDVVLRVATPSADTQSTEVTINGQTYTADFGFTGGWQEYQDVLVTNVSLDAGVQELRLDMKSSQFNLNYIDLVAAAPGANIDRTAPTAVLNTTAHTKNAQGVAPLEFTITYSDDKAINAVTIDANDLVVTAPDGSTAAVSLVGVDTAGNGTPRTATYAIAAPGGSWNGAEAGDYTIALKAGEVSDTNNNSAAAEVLGNLTLYVIGDDEEPTNPGTGNPGTGNPGTAGETIRIEAEDYKAGANGVAYFDTSQDNLGRAYRNDYVDIQTTGDVDGEFNIGWIRAEEFLTYDINIAEAGTYDVVLRVATAEASTKSINVVVGGTTSTASFGFTGGWQKYQDVVVPGVTLEAGAQELRLDFMSSKLNLNYFELVPQTTVVVDDVTAPIANLETTALIQPLDSQAAAHFTVTYSDDSAVNIATIGRKDIRVTAPDGTRFGANFVSVDPAGNGTPRTATYAITAPNGSWSEADAGEYSIFIKQGQVADIHDNALDAATLGTIAINVTDPQTAGDTIRIEAEDYKAGTNGAEYFDFDPDINIGGGYRPTEAVDIEATGDVDGGFNVGWIQDGEFLTYDVNVAAAGEYNIVLRVGANADNQAIEVVAGEQAYTANFNSTGGWQTYGDVIIGNVNLAAGTQEIRLNMKSSDFNLNYFELVPTAEFVDQTAPTATLNTVGVTKQPDTVTPANFTVNFTDNVGIDVSTIDDGDVTVTAPDGTVLDATLTRVNTDTDGTPRSAIYYIDAPGGTWDAADSGSYTVNLNAGEVADTNGNLAAAATVGSFNLNVSAPVDDNVIRINAGANTQGIDTNNKIWLPDTNFIGGQASTVNNAIANTGSDFIYQSQRSGNNFAYSIPVEDGNYSVTFHLAELDHNNAGARRFDVALEGEQVLDNYDIWQSTKNAFLEGTNTAKIVQVSDLVVARDGAIDLDFSSVIDSATIAGIEIAPIEGAQLLIQESNGNTVIAENGTSDTYQLLLNTQPTANVTVNLQPDGQSTVNQNTIVFTPQNWSVPQTVTINAVDDNAGESQHFSTIGHTISSADGNYSGLNAPSLTANVVDNDNVEVQFERKDAASPSLATVATWGPDGRLYVGSYTGNITAYTFDDNYNVTSEQSIGAIAGLTNNNITGLAFNPHDNDGGELKLYVSHNQFRANQESFDDHDFDENTEFSPYSGQVSVLSGANFDNLDPVVQNIGVSNHDHGVNGLLFDDNGDLLITVGSNTNVGIADDRIGGLPESPFTVAILKAEITKPDFNGNIQYELPDDWVAPAGFSGNFNPADSQGFGGDVDVVPGVDVSIYASGLRNSYDLVYATNGNIYATENGANSNFGDVSTSATTQEPFFDNPLDELNLIEEGGYYGQPNRNRGREDDRQNRFYSPDDASNGEYTAPIAQFKSSTNGLAEYRSTTFGSQLRGNLLAQNLDPGSDAILYNVDLSDDGQQVISNTELKTDGANGVPVGQGVDVLTGFSGAILSVDFFNGKLRVATPVDDNITTATAYEIDEWRAPASGGGTFTIGGVNFSNLNDTTVTIGEETASLISVSDKRIFGTLPAFDAGEYAAEGLLDITVASGGEVSTITDAFQPLFA